MTKSHAAVAVLLFAGATAKAATVTIFIDAGILENGAGTAVVPNGALVQILASPSGTFAPPTATSYATGDNVLLQSVATNSNSGTPGETLDVLSGLPLSSSLVSGEKLLLRFYPTLTFAGMPAAPTAGASYGQVRSDAVEFGPAGGDASETPWVLPSGGSTVDFDYITQNDGGTYANATANAAGTVAAVPEPGVAAAGGVAAVLRRRRAAARR